MEENHITLLKFTPGVIDITTDLVKADNIYIHAATSDNTRKAYRSDIQHFIAWVDYYQQPLKS